MQIKVRSLRRDFKREIPGTGFLGLFKEKETKRALNNVSFEIKKGEMMAYIGANGSGKSTTIKCLTGVMTPTSGEVKCMGYVPWEERIEYTENIGVVFGQKSLLWWDLAAEESFKLYRDIYGLPNKEYLERIDYFDDLISIKPLMDKQVRKMSFGERMRCELTASLLHKPKILFLDEPTIGMDVLAKEKVREFLKEINKNEKTTIMLTTHDIGDIEALCERMILLDQGRIIYDGKLSDFKNKYVNEKVIDISFSKIINKKKFENLLKRCELFDMKNDFVKCRIDTKEEDVGEFIDEIMDHVKVFDMKVDEPTLEHTIREVYRDNQI